MSGWEESGPRTADDDDGTGDLWTVGIDGGGGGLWTTNADDGEVTRFMLQKTKSILSKICRNSRFPLSFCMFLLLYLKSIGNFLFLTSSKYHLDSLY